MNAHIVQLVRSLLKKNSLEDCSVQELEQFANRHPFFGAAQLLLTKKLQVEKSDRYPEQLQKTFLFFHNPLWVEHLLNDQGTAIVTEKVAMRQPAVETISVPVTAEPAIAEPAPEEEHPPVHSGYAAPVEETAPIPEPAAETHVEEASAEANNTTDETPVENNGYTAPLETAALPSPPEPLPVATISAAATAGEELLFQPYHTVDYFASQGIRMREEDKPKDKFGVQLKSFTDWLKVMKKLPVTEIVKQVDVQSEQKVDQLAAHSLEGREVLTEAMAAVWEKQGNALKAIEIYGKLSLLDPAKSTYFAAKIEALKKSN